MTVARRRVPGVPSVFASNREAAAQLTDHLVETGRRRILFIGTPEPGSDLDERHRGYREALAAHRLEAAPAVEAPPDEASGFAVADRLLADGVPADAVVCGNDLLALPIMQRFAEAGVRVPDDVAVTGWDDLHAARYVRPGLTTVAQPTRDLGRAAALALHTHRVARDEVRPEAQVLDSHVVHRGSCCNAELDTLTERMVRHRVKGDPP